MNGSESAKGEGGGSHIEGKQLVTVLEPCNHEGWKKRI